MGLFSANTNEWIIEKKCVKIPTGRRQTNCLCTKRPRSWTWGERELQQGRRLRPGTTNNTRVLTTQPHWCCFLSAKNILMRSLYERRAGILIKKYCDGVISLCQAFVQRKWGKKKWRLKGHGSGKWLENPPFSPEGLTNLIIALIFYNERLHFIFFVCSRSNAKMYSDCGR